MIKDIRLLIEFASVVQAGSFSKAAKDLGVAQPWLSVQVRKLEDQLGVQLLDRSHGKIQLTRWGKDILEIALPLSFHAKEALTRVAAIANKAPESVRLGVSLGSGVNQIAAVLIEKAGLNHLNSDLSIEWGISIALMDRLRQGAVDMALIVGSAPNEDIEAIPICSVHLDLMVRADDPLASKTVIKPGDLAGRMVSSFPRDSNPEIYDLLFGSLSNDGITIDRFPDLGINAEGNPDLWPELYVKLSLSTSILQPTPIPGVVRIYFDIEQNLELSLARPKGELHGVVRRKLWASAEEFKKE